MRLFSPKSGDSRPVTDRVKESLFSVLHKYELPAGKVVADLFCGVGSLGTEALSRQALFVTFVEKDPWIIPILKRNIEKAGFTENSEVIRADAFRFGSEIDTEPNKYDLVFVDPPYADTEEVGLDSATGKLLVSLTEKLTEQAIVVVRTRKNTELLAKYGRLEITERRQCGSMAVTILR